MRRASEMAWVDGIVQVGMRGQGSARAQEVVDAEAHGARLITAGEVHREGIATAIASVPEGANCIITLDCDGLDPAIMPAVLAREPGGLSYWHVVELIQGLGARANIVGFDIVELAPTRDQDGLGALTAARIVCNAIGTIARQR